jgi:hypothetical protein
MRQQIFDILNLLYPTFNIGQHKGNCTATYLVVKFNSQSMSATSQLGAFQIFDVMVYMPDTSFSDMEFVLDQIKASLQNASYEETGVLTPDYRDTAIQAFTRSIEFRIPKGLN